MDEFTVSIIAGGEKWILVKAHLSNFYALLWKTRSEQGDTLPVQLSQMLRAGPIRNRTPDGTAIEVFSATKTNILVPVKETDMLKLQVK